MDARYDDLKQGNRASRMSNEGEGGLSSDGPVRGPVRRNAGDYLQIEHFAEQFAGLLTGLLAVVFLVGVGLTGWLGLGSGISIGAASLVTALVLWRRRQRQREDFRKGHVAERQVGRALEMAITQKDCAVAHNVMGIMDLGDIDHIVATPQSVWVIETKYRRVPRRRFPRVLSRLHACRAEIEALMPPGTPVRACLVLAYEEDGVQRKRDGGILVYNHRGFRREFLPRLQAERNEPRTVDQRTPGMIWQMGLGEPVASLAGADAPEPKTGERTSAGSDSAPKAYARWTREDEEELLRLHDAGWELTQIADHFGRQPNAIKSRLRNLQFVSSKR